MESSTVIVLIDEGLHIHAQMLEIPIPVGVDLLPLQRVQEALTTGVGPREVFSSYGSNANMFFQSVFISTTVQFFVLASSQALSSFPMDDLRS